MVSVNKPYVYIVPKFVMSQMQMLSVNRPLDYIPILADDDQID